MIRKLQREVKQLYEAENYNAKASTLVIGAMEELGELATAILLTECKDFRPSRKKMSLEQTDVHSPAQEVGDCITYLLALCNVLGVTPYFKWRT